MRDDMYENKWNPFDPEWYQHAFDKFISTADQLFNQETIIKDGFVLPDADGSKSSVFRNNAVLNNSFNEKALREAVKDIYLNSSHKLIASNHDNTHFYQWHGHMSDMKLIENTGMCEFTIPAEVLLSSKERDRYKLSQFYRKWIKVEDILNNWDVFKWCYLVFINQKIFSEYELRMDDHEMRIRFKYNDYWVRKDFPVYIYKFDTNSSCRVLISREQCENMWDWKVPIEYIPDKRILNSNKVIVLFNKICDSNIRQDGLTHVEILGDNLEFLTIKDGYIDLSDISSFNRNYILSESKEWLWMSIIVPKFFHEYPILLPTDAVYRPYEADFQPVVTIKNNVVKNVKVDEQLDGNMKQVYVDMKGHLKDKYDGWNQMIRPVVLADAFDSTNEEPYEAYIDELTSLRDRTVEGADLIEDFRFFLQDYPTEEKFNKFIDDLVTAMINIKDAYETFIKKRRIDIDIDYETRYNEFISIIYEIKEEGEMSDWFNPPPLSDKDFWLFISPMIHIPRDLADKFYVVQIMKEIGKRKNLWISDDEENSLLDKIRFQRPIDETDFWTFEYNIDDKVWRPYPLKMNRHFPDVYFPKDESEDVPTMNRVFKTFFFYSDTMNVLNESSDVIKATPSWDDDLQEYQFDQGAVYRDIFMEKFYWMGVRAIYKGLLATKCRWEALEYVVNNDSYERFNKLFIETMDPYFKLGLATYLKSDNFEFPFDDAIYKMEESITSKLNGYKRVTNYEVYLNKSWIPSYFDYVTKIMDNWNYDGRLLRRPRRTFDIDRLLPIMNDVQKIIFDNMNELQNDLLWLVSELYEESYGLNIDNIKDLSELVTEVYQNITHVIKFTKELDLEIYSIDDVNYIISLFRKHIEFINIVGELFAKIYEDTINNNVYLNKRMILQQVESIMNRIPNHIEIISGLIHTFDMDGFMKATNDLDTYFNYAKINPDDKSLIGGINQFEDPWSDKVKEYRDKLFQSTAILYGTYEPSKSYNDDEVNYFVECVTTVKTDIKNFSDVLTEFWDNFKLEHNNEVIDHLEYIQDFIDKIVATLMEYIEARENLRLDIVKINDLLASLDDYHIGETESAIRMEIIVYLGKVLSDMSYIAGKNRKDDALIDLGSAELSKEKYMYFLIKEEEVFCKLIRISKTPVGFIEILLHHKDILDAMIDYMDTVNIKYIPDSSWPTYSDIYEVTSIEISNGGFLHNVGDHVFIPNLGTYKIDRVEGAVSIATSLSDIELSNHRNTTFRDPMSQNRPYDSITNGSGVGIMVKPLSMTHTRIINDEVIKNFITRINNVIYMISRYIDIPNNHNNYAYKDTLENITKIKDDWDNIVDIYNLYMTPEVVVYMYDLISILDTITKPSEVFILVRDSVDVLGLIYLFQDFIFTSYEYNEKFGRIDQSFSFYDENIRVAFNKLSKFYGNGTSWKDGKELMTILDDISYPIKNYKLNVFDKKEHEEDIGYIESLYENVLDYIWIVKYALSKLSKAAIDVRSVIRQLESKIEDIPELHKDVWYHLNKASVAVSGEGYKVGDIVEIIQELPTDDFGNEIHDMEDIIFNDVILLQISEIINDKVTKVTPMMDYALPYLIWGVRNTITRIGNGSGLLVDIFSKELEISDSTIFNDSGSDIAVIPQFDENDMFTFKFENIHDLNINYEVFYGGKQISNFFQRHISSTDPLHPSSIDVLYLYANEVMDLQNSSIYIPAEQYFIYKIDDIIIKDPGTGYCEGQDIFVDAGSIALRLKVAQLAFTPLKEIASIDIESSNLVYEGTNPEQDNAKVSSDSMNNIDDEYNDGYYDRIPGEGIVKPATRSLDPDEYQFTSKRFDDLADGTRNSKYMYPDVDMPDIEDAPTNGDPDNHLYQGNRIDNSQHPMSDSRRWNGIMNTIPNIHPVIPDDRRVPTGQPVKGEYQMIKRLRIHDNNDVVSKDINDKSQWPITNRAMILGDLFVDTFADLPKHTEDWSKGGVGKVVIVEHDETNNGHRMAYRIRTFVAAGFFVYNLPEPADIEWNITEVDWMKDDWYPDLPTSKAQYPDAPWATAKSYRVIQEGISDKKYTRVNYPEEVNSSSYIHDVTLDDLSVFNWTTKKWEDLHDEKRWRLERIEDPENGKYGFNLVFLGDYFRTGYTIREINKAEVTYIWNNDGEGYGDLHEGEVPKEPIDDIWKNNGEGYKQPEDKELDFDLIKLIWDTDGAGYIEPEAEYIISKNDHYSYDMIVYLNKTPETQMRNASLKRNAVMDIKSSIIGEVNKAAINLSVNTGRHLRIRKLFPYEQKERFTIGISQEGDPLGYEMDFKMAPYMHFKNEIHLEDIKIYNKTAGRFENLLDTQMFEVRFKDPKAVSRGYETNTTIVRSLIGKAGEGFIDGEVWGWNAERGISIFGRVTAEIGGNGHLLTFTPTHCPNPPEESISLEFHIFQNETQREVQMAIVMVEFKTEKTEMFGDGYIHNVTNRFAPVPEEFKVIAQYDLSGPTEYDIIISKSAMKWEFVKSNWMMSPIFHVPDYNVQQDRVYILSDKGRFPLINPSTGKPSLRVEELENGTNFIFLNLYRRYEKMEVHSVPYPMRSVYVQRRIPSSGYIDLTGKLNKPLNKKYFEFWVNGRLLYDEVTIITPTRIFLHGLKSLRNLEIIEVNRDPNEYFSDIFLEVSEDDLKRPYQSWNFNTYLDDALTGNLEGDNYTKEEQEYLLSPVWTQVEHDHPEFKNFPPNTDVEDDILLRVNPDDYPIDSLASPLYQFLMIDTPTLEGQHLVDRSMTFEHFGFIPISDSMLIDMMNEEWKDEIANDPYFHEHAVMSEDEWYGTTARLYDEYGVLVHNLNDAAYQVADTNLLKINTSTKISKIIQNNVVYDLT